MDLAIIIVADEVLQGFTLDTNSNHIAAKLRGCGHRVARISTIGDDGPSIGKELRAALDSDVDGIFVCGGLGTTPDDITMASVADALGLRLEESGRAKEWLLEVVPKWKDNYRKMIMLPEGAGPLRNRVGAASGAHIVRGTKAIFVLPGVPKELEDILANEILGPLIPDFGGTDVFRQLSVRRNEGDMHDLLNRLHTEHPEASIGSYPQRRGLVILRVHGAMCPVERVMAVLKEELGNDVEEIDTI